MVPESEHWTHHQGQLVCLFVLNTDALESIFSKVDGHALCTSE